MGDLFYSFTPVNPEYNNKKLEQLSAYEEHYMKLLQKYKPEIEEIERMMENLRCERKNFYEKTLPQVEMALKKEEVSSIKAKQMWISEFVKNMEKSFEISDSLISHYITSNLEEFKEKMQSVVDKV